MTPIEDRADSVRPGGNPRRSLLESRVMTSAINIAVPLLDLKAQYATIRSEIEPAVQEVLESQIFIGGPKVAEFECRCAGYLDVPFTVGNSSGSDALILALDALGVGPEQIPAEPLGHASLLAEVE